MSDVAAPAAAPSAPSSTPSTPAPAAAKPAAPVAAKPGAPAPAPATEKAEAPKPATEKFLIKVNGKMRELSRDDAMRELQKGFASRENFEKGAQLTRRNQALLKALADPDPGRQDEALKALGVDPDAIAERRLAERAKRAQMSPEQQRIAELEQQIAQREHESKSHAERAEQERTAALERQIWQQTEQQFIGEIDRATQAGELAGLPQAEALYLMADAAEMNLAYGLDLPPGELLAEAKQRVADARAELQTKLISGMQGPALLDFLGTDAVNAVIRAARDRFKAGTPIQTLQKPAAIAEQEPEQAKRKWIRPGDIKTPFL